MVMLVALALTVSACSRVEAPPQLRTVLVKPDVPPFTREACKRTPVPQRLLTAREVFSLWSKDRLEITDCDRKRQAILDSVK
jgi:hypothetical protein